MNITMIYKVWYRNFIVWTKYIKPSLVANLGEPLLYLLLMGYGMGKLVPEIHGIKYIDFLAPGLILSSAMYASSFEATISSYTRMITQKTYDAIMVTPVNLSEIISGEIIWSTTKGLISSVFFIAIMAMFGLIHSWLFMVSIVAVIMDGLFFSTLSMIFVGFSHSYEFFNYFFTLILTPLFLFSGIFFPIDTLPKLVRDVALYLPLTPMVELARVSNNGTLNYSAFLLSLLMGMISIPMGILSYRLIKKRLIK
ncbi:MAG: ABC transporter permease [Deltaproteobacteria bacterium]|nr:ABC transporter permease [Deltaproteobacteria bacterium]MCL5277604.1 ABC transporter permease [Deltaproteobacteria bacterium]